MYVLLVEDDKIIGDAVSQGLRMQDYVVDWVEDREAAESALEANQYEMFVLDIGLPDGSGFDVLKKIRSAGNQNPVLILTAFDDVSYKIKGLDAGADDYLVKPFDLNELFARMRAMRRRGEGRAVATINVGPVALDPIGKVVTLDGSRVDLGSREFAILQTLMEHPGRIQSKNQIEDRLYGWDMEIESNTVEVHIHGLRKKLGKSFIKTIRNMGYQVGE